MDALNAAALFTLQGLLCMFYEFHLDEKGGGGRGKGWGRGQGGRHSPSGAALPASSQTCQRCSRWPHVALEGLSHVC